MKRTIVHGHVLTELRKLAAADVKVQMVVTSPPYYGLRDYGTEPQIWGGSEMCDHWWIPVVKRKTSGSRTGATIEGFDAPDEVVGTREDKESFLCAHCDAWKGELGQEPTPDRYIRHIMQVCAGIRDVLRDDGTFWLNIGDSRSASGHGWGGGSISEASGHSEKCGGYKGRKPPPCWSLKQKDLMLVPFRMVIALQEAGWYVRQVNIWNKPNPMRESAKDRPTTAHEYVFLLSKSPHYYYDWYAVAEPVKADTVARGLRARGNDHKHSDGAPGQPPHSFLQAQPNLSNGKAIQVEGAVANKMSVWTITAASFAEDHFAVFPEDLVKVPILAGTSERGACAKCGAPYFRVLEDVAPDLNAQRACGGDSFGEYFGEAVKEYEGTGAQDASEVKKRILASMMIKRTRAWLPDCQCVADVVPCTVLDPFSGSGTTAKVAGEYGRSFIGIDLKPEFVEMAKRRSSQMGLTL